MLGPAEFEDIRLDLADAERERLNGVALAALDRHWVDGARASVEAVTRIRDLVVARAAGCLASDWKGILSEAAGEVGYLIRWNGEEVAVLEPYARSSSIVTRDVAAIR